MNSLRGRITNRQLSRHFIQRLQNIELRSCSTATSKDSGISNGKGEFQIPFRKERSSIDILVALEKTIKRDPTAPHYKYVDDPYLSPMSNRGKRTFALSKEAGRKAAMWILAEHSELFNHRIAEPEVKAFLPKAKYENKDEVSEELLLSIINEGSVTDALKIYKLLENETSVECKQALLELLCYHNSQEQLPDDLIEERWYRKAASRQRQIWRSCQELEELFEFLKKQDKPVVAAAYNALICGTAKYMQVNRAWDLYEECREKKIPLSLVTYNCLIQLVSVLRDGAKERKSLLFELLGEINQAGLSPNIGTLNSALRVASTINVQNVGKEVIKSLLIEFKKLGVEPCLASYYFVLVTFCKDFGPKSMVLREIINELEGKEFTMQDPSDTFFFVTAMDVAKNHLEDRELAEKIHKLLLTGNNYDLIGEGYKESIYYRHYMVLLLKTMPFEEFMRLYDIMVPNIYIPEPSVMKEILDILELTESTTASDVLTRLWSHMVMFEQLDRENLMTKSFDLMRTKCSPDEDSPINQQYAEAANTYWNYIKEIGTYRDDKKSWTGKLIADIAILALRGGDFDRFIEVVALMAKEQSSIIGEADIEQLNIIFEACLERGDALGALDILQYSVDCGFEESAAMARKIQSNIPLSPDQEMRLTGMIGTEVLKTKSTSDENVNEMERLVN